MKYRIHYTEKYMEPTYDPFSGLPGEPIPKEEDKASHWAEDHPKDSVTIARTLAYLDEHGYPVIKIEFEGGHEMSRKEWEDALKQEETLTAAGKPSLWTRLKGR